MSEETPAGVDFFNVLPKPSFSFANQLNPVPLSFFLRKNFKGEEEEIPQQFESPVIEVLPIIEGDNKDDIKFSIPETPSRENAFQRITKEVEEWGEEEKDDLDMELEEILKANEQEKSLDRKINQRTKKRVRNLSKLSVKVTVPSPGEINTSNNDVERKSALSPSVEQTLSTDTVDEFGFYVQKSKEIGMSDASNPNRTQLSNDELLQVWNDWIQQREEFDLSTTPSTSNTTNNKSYYYYDWINVEEEIVEIIKHNAIPQRLRPTIWKHLAATSKDFNIEAKRRLLECSQPESVGWSIYYELLSRGDENEFSSQIKLDVFRTFSTHSLFSRENEDGQRKLFNLLLVYSYWNPHIGYCQGMSFVAAVLLMHMSEVEAFWLFEWMLSEKRSGDYYVHSMKGILEDSQVLDTLLKTHYPLLFGHMAELGVHPLMYVTPWFMTLFTHLCSWHTVLRVFDFYFIEGQAAIFRFALGLLHSCQESLLQVHQLDLILPILQNIPYVNCHEAHLLSVAKSIPVHHYLKHYYSSSSSSSSAKCEQQKEMQLSRRHGSGSLHQQNARNVKQTPRISANTRNAVTSAKQPNNPSFLEKFWSSISTPSRPPSSKLSTPGSSSSNNGSAKNNNNNNNSSSRKRKEMIESEPVLVCSYELTPMKSPKKIQKLENNNNEQKSGFTHQRSGHHQTASENDINSSNNNHHHSGFLSPLSPTSSSSKKQQSPRKFAAVRSHRSPKSPLRSPKSPHRKARASPGGLKYQTQRNLSAAKVSQNSPLPELQ